MSSSLVVSPREAFDKLIVPSAKVGEVLEYYSVIATNADDYCLTLTISLPENTEVSAEQKVEIARDLVKELQTLLNTSVKMVVEYTTQQSIIHSFL